MAAARELLVMVGGSLDAVDRCRPIFETFGDPVLHLGPLGSGQEAKLLNNTAFAAQLALACEVFAVAADRNLDLEALATVLSRGSGRSYAAEVIGGSGYNLETLGPLAGPLLAKDFGILLDCIGPKKSLFIEAAREALVRMKVSPAGR
jgi:3-hydroxyisobutyrate dehydrogenase-like beta-hydroxyacid dehydrogenase